jgi:hypothetical protein
MKIVGSKYKKTIQRPLNMIGKNEHKEISWVCDSFARKRIENCWFKLKSQTIQFNQQHEIEINQANFK